jgi:hypothetical protein
MSAIAIIIGIVMVVLVLADLVNTLVTTTTSQWKWWLTRILYRRSWAMVSAIGARIKDESRRERLFALFAPISVLVMLVAWVVQQVLGFALIWWGAGGISGIDGLLDSIYFSGVVYFTVGFGEVVPVEHIPRFGALIEAFSGVLTTALVIGYLPALYSAYSEREQKLLTLDDGSEDRITPTNLVISRAPGGDPRELDTFFSEWEAWIAQVLETHTTFPMLSLFRSQHPGQSWITALGLVTDAALHVELTVDGQGRSAYWALRRSARLLHMLTDGADLSAYRKALDESYDGSNSAVFQSLYDTMDDHGFPMLSYEEARVHSRELRVTYDAQLEYLIDALHAPRGFWGHEIGHKLTIRGAQVPLERWDGMPDPRGSDLSD